MKANLERIEKNQVALEIEVETPRFEQALHQAYKRVVKRVEVPGFRKGKTPRRVIEARFGKGILLEEALEIILPEAYSEAVAQTEIEPIDQPKIDLVKAEEGEPLVFKAMVEVKPEVELGQYKGLELVKKVTEVTEKQVNDYLEILQRRHARLVSVPDGIAAEEDVAVIDFVGTIDGKPFPGGEAQNFSLMLGSGAFIPGFEEQVIGLAVGESKEIKVSFPDDYYVKDLAGKEAVFQVKIKELKRKEYSPIDDEFAKDVSEFDTLKELKESVANKLKQISETRAVKELQNEAVTKVAENAVVEIPKVMVERRIDRMIGDLADRLAQQGLTVEKYLEMIKSDEDQLRQEMRPDAEKSVKADLALEAVAKKEKLEVTEAELDDAIAKLAASFNKTPEEMRKTFEQQGTLPALKNSLLMDKTVEFLVDQAKVTEKIIHPEEAETEETGSDSGKKAKSKKSTKAAGSAEAKSEEAAGSPEAANSTEAAGSPEAANSKAAASSAGE